MTERDTTRILRGMKELKDEIRRSHEETAALRKESQRRSFDLPPDWILRAAKDALQRQHNWEAACSVLTAYYSIPTLHSYHDPNRVPKDAVACYYEDENTQYSKERTVPLEIVMHELGHHICAKLPMRIGGEPEQAFCDAFAAAIAKKWATI